MCTIIVIKTQCTLFISDSVPCMQEANVNYSVIHNYCGLVVKPSRRLLLS